MSAINFPNPFEAILEALNTLSARIEAIEKHLKQSSGSQTDDVWMSIEDLRKYHPTKPTLSMIYAWTNKRAIPHYKRGRRLFFKRDEVDLWLSENRKKTASEIDRDADQSMRVKKEQGRK